MLSGSTDDGLTLATPFDSIRPKLEFEAQMDKKAASTPEVIIGGACCPFTPVVSFCRET